MRSHSYSGSVGLLWNRPIRHALSVLFFFFLLLCSVAGDQTVRLKDHSDWWSINNESFHPQNVKPKSEDIDARSFQILGIALGSSENMRLAARLGEVTAVERGDASTGRLQACYSSAGNSQRVYAIFEFGEDTSNFYLFTGGADWIGSRFCLKTKRVSLDTATASGLRLGMSRAQLEAILGKADYASGGRLVYFRDVQRKATAAQFERQRKEYPAQLSDEVAHKWFDFYEDEMYIEARFVASKLSYLAVSTSGEPD